jgi:predicted ABC-type ATPase
VRQGCSPPDLLLLEQRLARFGCLSSIVQASTQERHDAITDPIGRLLLLSLGEVLPGARVLDWDVQSSGIIGRAAAEGLVYRFRTDANEIAYRPAWPNLTEAEWETRSSGFLLIRNPEQRQDFKGVRFHQKRSRRQCSKGYGCGSACIALAKECRITPASAISKQRLSALQTLVREGDPRAQAMAAQVAGARLQQAGSVRDQRQVDRLRKMLQDPEVAAMVRSGRIPGGRGNSPVNDAPLAGTVQVVVPSQINVDPKRFQYKIVSNAAGEVGSLRDVRKWDDNLAGVISVWQDPANGKTFVVNGHNRLGLARRQGVEGVTVRYLKAANAKEARAIGAMQNIAEGQGTEVDAAKFFRDSGIRNREDVEARGLPLTSGKAAKGLALAGLPREMFDRVVQGDLSVNRGAIIGGSGLDAGKQREIGKLLKTRPSVSDGTLGEYVEALAASQRQQQQTINLFGTSTEEVDTGLARAELVNGITRKIGRERRLFSMVSGSKAAAALQEKAGNQINREASGEVASTADRLGRMFKELKNLSGPMSEAINAAAARLTQGEKREKVQRDLYEDVVAAMQAELKRAGLAPKAPSREAATTDSSAPTGMALLERLESRADAMRRRCSTGYGCGSSCISVAKECRSKPASSIGRERIRRLQQLARGEIKPRGLGAPTGVEASSMAQDLEGRRAAQAADLAARRLARSAVPAKPSGALLPTGSGASAVEAEIVGGASTLVRRHQAVAPASAAPRLSDVIRESLNAMKAIDARQMARTAENLFEAGWSLERRKKYKGMSKEKAREQFKVEFLRQMEAGSGAVQTKELAGAGEKAASTGSVAGAMRSLISEMKGQDQRLADLESASIDLRVRAKNLEIGGTGDPLELTSPGRAAPRIKPAGKASGLEAQDVSTAKQQAQFARQQRHAAMAAGDQQGAEAWGREERTVERARVQAAARRAQQSQTSLFGATDYDESLPLFGRRDAALAAIEDRLDALRRKCSTGYSCGYSCISVQKECRIRPMSALTRNQLKRLRHLASGERSSRKHGEKPSADRRIAHLTALRLEIGKSLVANLSKQREDGLGNYIENPDASAMRRIKATAARVAKIDRELNMLEGKDPEQKRWIDGDPFGLARYSDIQSPGRQDYERKVIKREISGATAGDQAVFMSGGPASGKTSLLNKQFGDAKGFAVIDPDRLKGYDPVMVIGVAMGMREAAALAHENSSRLSKQLYATVRNQGLNMLMDGTGANSEKYINQIQELKRKGYKITLLAQHVEEEVGIDRALKRADLTGRYVPPEFIRHAYEVIPGNFERIARVADSATLNDGQSNEVIMQYQDGRLVGGSRQRTADYRKLYGKPKFA